MKKMVFFLLFIFVSTYAQGKDYRFISPLNFKKLIESGQKVHLIDLQKEEDFAKKHIKGSIETYAYPVKSDEDKQKLDAIIEKIKKDNLDIIIICPRGGNAAKNAYDYMLSKGITEDRLYILEGGIKEFPYGEMCQTK